MSQFATQYFRCRYIFLQRHSLEALINIARHPPFGPTVHILDVSHVTGALDVWGPDLRYYPVEGDDAQIDEEPSEKVEAAATKRLSAFSALASSTGAPDWSTSGKYTV